MEYYSATKENEIMYFAVTWMDLEITKLSEVSQTKNKYHITYMWNLKNYTNKLIYKTETDSETENKLMGTKEEEWRERINNTFSISRYILL